MHEIGVEEEDPTQETQGTVATRERPGIPGEVHNGGRSRHERTASVTTSDKGSSLFPPACHWTTSWPSKSNLYIPYARISLLETYLRQNACYKSLETRWVSSLFYTDSVDPQCSFNLIPGSYRTVYLLLYSP